MLDFQAGLISGSNSLYVPISNNTTINIKGNWALGSSLFLIHIDCVSILPKHKLYGTACNAFKNMIEKMIE